MADASAFCLKNFIPSVLIVTCPARNQDTTRCVSAIGATTIEHHSRKRPLTCDGLPLLSLLQHRAPSAPQRHQKNIHVLLCGAVVTRALSPCFLLIWCRSLPHPRVFLSLSWNLYSLPPGLFSLWSANEHPGVQLCAHASWRAGGGAGGQGKEGEFTGRKNVIKKQKKA